jgi:hypothetical protein
MGVVLMKRGRFSNAAARCERALDISPDYASAHFNKANFHLLSGDFDTGWREYEWRWRVKEMNPHGLSAPLWDGKTFQVKPSFSTASRGLGDRIQFIRYAPLVKELGGTVWLSCPPHRQHCSGACMESTGFFGKERPSRPSTATRL